MSHNPSLSKRKAEADIDSSEAAAPKRQAPRPFHAGPDPVAHANDGQEHADEAEPAEPADVAAPASASAAAPSPRRQVDVSLRCVFRWLHLAELHRALSVSKQWRANVSAMPSIGARVRWADDELKVLSSMCASSLARHVASLEPSLHPWPRVWSAVVSDLARVSERMSGLRHLHVQLVMPTSALGPGLLAFPQRLTKLDLKLVWRSATADAQRALMLQRVMGSIGALASLEEISLDVQVTDPAQRAAVSFEPMRALHGLRSFTFSWLVAACYAVSALQTLTAAQLDALRYLASSHALVTLHLFAGWMQRMLDDMMARNESKPLLVHDLNLSGCPMTAARVPTLSCFPSLRILNPVHIEVVDFLPAMTQLHTLAVCPSEGSEVTPDQLVDAIVPLTQLTALTLGYDRHEPLTEAHLMRILSPLTSLRTLRLEGLQHLRSLSFLSSGPITRSLTSFTVSGCYGMSSSELLHVHACKRLTSLKVHFSFDDRLGAFGVAFYEQRPCPTLPALQHFIYQGESEDE